MCVGTSALTAGSWKEDGMLPSTIGHYVQGGLEWLAALMCRGATSQSTPVEDSLLTRTNDWHDWMSGCCRVEACGNKFPVSHSFARLAITAAGYNSTSHHPRSTTHDSFSPLSFCQRLCLSPCPDPTVPSCSRNAPEPPIREKKWI